MHHGHIVIEEGHDFPSCKSVIGSCVGQVLRRREDVQHQWTELCFISALKFMEMGWQ